MMLLKNKIMNPWFEINSVAILFTIYDRRFLFCDTSPANRLTILVTFMVTNLNKS